MNNIIKQKIDESRSQGIKKVSIENVIPGLKFIIENPSISDEELIDGLLDLGCNFDFQEIKDQFQKDRIDPAMIGVGLMRTELPYAAAAIAIALYGDDEDRKFVRGFAKNDDNKSFYRFIRTVTSDETYTKENVDKNINTKKMTLKNEE
ncbi:MAG: hypothetical protein IKE73_00075 [Bacilli bacterium]|nr:hypothetical protein [Bacilli bacterium]